MTRSFAIRVLVDCGSSLPCPTGNPSSRRCGMWLIIKRVYVGISSDRYSEVEREQNFLLFLLVLYFTCAWRSLKKIIQRQGVLYTSWSKHSENWVGSQMVQQFGQSQSSFPFRIRSSCNFINCNRGRNLTGKSGTKGILVVARLSHVLERLAENMEKGKLSPCYPRRTSFWANFDAVFNITVLLSPL